MFEPRLLDGNTYDVMLRNLWRLLTWGTPIAEARRRVLQQARVLAFPDPPALLEMPEARTGTNSLAARGNVLD